MAAPRSASTATPRVPSSAATAAAGASARKPSAKTAAPASAFFLKERERIITEIADSMEQLLGNVNTLNRKLEESVAVGQEFEPIANLWGPFVEMLTSHGIAPDGADGVAEQQQYAHAGQGASAATVSTPVQLRSSRGAAEEDAFKASLDGASGNRLPPGVAPGGGTVYGMSSST